MPPTQLAIERDRNNAAEIQATLPPPEKNSNEEDFRRSVSTDRSRPNTLDHRKRPDLDFEERRKRRLFTTLTIPGIVILLSFASYHLYHNNWIEGFSDLAAGIWLCLILITFRTMKSVRYVYRFNTFFIGCLFVFLAIKGGVQGNKLMWAFSFPPIAFYTLGKKEGCVSTACFFLLIIGILYQALPELSVHEYAPEFKVRFCMAFLLVAVWTYIYESVREQFQTNLQDERNKLDSEKSKFAQLSTSLANLNRALE